MCPFYEGVIWPSGHLNDLPEVTLLVSDAARMWIQYCHFVGVFPRLCGTTAAAAYFRLQCQSDQLFPNTHTLVLNPCTEGRWCHQLLRLMPCLLFLLKHILLYCFCCRCCYFWGPHTRHMKVPPRGLNQCYSCQPIPQQHRIQAASATYAIAHSNTGSRTHWARLGIEPESSWILVRFNSTEPQKLFF